VLRAPEGAHAAAIRPQLGRTWAMAEMLRM
jgi:hypothetical protein